MSKLALGTAQFGLAYGINNERGMVPEPEVRSILDLAAASGIELLDTAFDYGSSEEVLGRYLRAKNNAFKVVTKLADNERSKVKEKLAGSLGRLGGNLYGCIIHEFAAYQANPGIYEVLQEAQSAGQVNKIGFSLYYPAELDRLLEKNVPLDLLQLPYNIFDQRFAGYFDPLKKQGVEVHVRSVFLQGLVFRSPDRLPGKLGRLTGKLKKLARLSGESGRTIAELCLNFALLEPGIDQVVVGVDSLDDLKNDLAGESERAKVVPFRPALLDLKEDDEELILPFKWEAS